MPIKREISQKKANIPVQMDLFEGVKFEDLYLLKSQGKVAVICRGLCLFTYDQTDRFSRNYCIVQLHISCRIKLKSLSELFELNYQNCSRFLSRFNERGVAGLKEDTTKRFKNREIINSEIGSMIISERLNGISYEQISEKIRFLFRKKIKVSSLRAWVYRQKQSPAESGVVLRNHQQEMDVKQEFCNEELQKQWHRNIYAGSMILYALIQRTDFLRAFEENIKEDFLLKDSSSGVRRVILTLFFLHALRCKSIEQSKHIIGRDFSQIIGGSFLRLQSLRYAVDKIIETEGFDKAIDMYYQNLIVLTEIGDRILYTDGHFSSYYGQKKIPKGWDARRQMGIKGRNTISLHNSAGENIYFFESPTNTSLGNDIEKLIEDIEKFGVTIKRKTLIFDRGGYSQKCFAFLKSKKMYFVTYLKNRKKERRVDDRLFEEKIFISEEGEGFSYKIYEGDRRWMRGGLMRIILFMNEDGRQVPVLTSNPYMKAERVIYLLTRRWREENCFKFMMEHFGIDLLTSYKAEPAPNKKIKKPNPERKKINQAITKKKNELLKLQNELATRVAAAKNKTMQEFFEQEKDLTISIKFIQVELESLQRAREKISSEIEIDLSHDHVIMSQKRRLFINALKAINYNVEKWFQIKFRKYHAKSDEVLSMIRSLWRQPGRIREDGRLVEVEIEALDNRAMNKSLEQFIEELSQNKGLRMSDGRILRIKLTRRVSL